MADEQPDNWRYYVAFDNVFDDPYAPFSSNTEAAHRGIDAVVAEVRADEARQWSLTAGRAFRGGRQAAAQDIRAVREYPFSDAREHYARIAEGNTDHA